MIARLAALAVVGMGAACSPPDRPAEDGAAPPAPMIEEPALPPAAPAVQLGEAPRLKDEPR